MAVLKNMSKISKYWLRTLLLLLVLMGGTNINKKRF